MPHRAWPVALSLTAPTSRGWTATYGDASSSGPDAVASIRCSTGTAFVPVAGSGDWSSRYRLLVRPRAGQAAAAAAKRRSALDAFFRVPNSAQEPSDGHCAGGKEPWAIDLLAWLEERGVALESALMQRARSGRMARSLSNAGHYQAVFRSMANHRMWLDAIELLDLYCDRISDPEWGASPELVADPAVFEAAMSAFVKADSWRASIWALDKMLDCTVSPTASAFNLALASCEPGGQWELSLSLLGRMPLRSLGASTTSRAVSSVMKACQSRAPPHITARLMQSLETTGRSLKLKAEATNRWAAARKSRRETRAENALLKRSAVGELDGDGRAKHSPELLNEARSLKDPDELMAVAYEITSRGMLVTKNHLTIVMKAMAKAVCWRSAVHLLDDVAYRKRNTLCVMAVTEVMNACGNCRQWRQVLNLFSRMGEYELAPDIFHFNAALSACSKATQWLRAFALFRACEEYGLRPDTVTINSLMVGLRGKQSDLATEALRMMKDRHVHANLYAYTTVLAGWEAAGLWREAIAVMDDIRDRHLAPDLAAYGSVLGACESARQWKPALHLLGQMQRESIIPGARVYGTVAGVLISAERHWQAAFLLLEARERGIAPDALTCRHLLTLCQVFGRWRSALDMLVQLRELPARLTASDFKVAMEVCMEKGRWRQVGMLLEEMEDAGCAPDRVTRAIALRASEAASGNEAKASRPRRSLLP